MPRKPAAARRRDRHSWTVPRGGRQHINGVSATGLRILARLESAGDPPASTADALSEYRYWLLHPRYRDDYYLFGCGAYGCGADPEELREWLEYVTPRLPRRDRPVFRRVLELDPLW